jgi:hypothetical protein
MDVADTAGILGNSQTVADWEKAFCDQVIGSGLLPGVKGCRILTETAATAATTASATAVGVSATRLRRDCDETALGIFLLAEG